MKLTTTPSRPRARYFYLAPLAAACLAFAFVTSRTQEGLTPLQVSSDVPASAAMESSANSARMWAPIEFRLAPGLDASTDKVASWRLKTGDASAFRAFAARIGVEGELVEERYGPRPADSSWRIGDLSGTSSGFFSWSNSRLYGSPEMQARMTVSSCSVSSEDTATSCSPQAPTTSFTPPSDAEARFQLAPFYPDADLTSTYSSTWSHVYTAAYRLGDVSVPDLGSAEVSDLGVLYVSGVFTEFEKMGAYPTITAVEAVPRLASNLSMMARIEPALGCDLPQTDLPVPPSNKAESPSVGAPVQPSATSPDTNIDTNIDTSIDTSKGVGATNIAPIACGPERDAPVRIVELVSVSPSYTSTYDADGRLWVVPAWLYTDRDGATYSAVALADAYYKTVPGSVSLPAVPPIVAPPAAVPGASGAAVPGFDPTRYIGTTLDEAQRRATKDGFSSRVVMLDGEGQMVTADYRSDRLGFTVVDGVVTDVAVG